jgi:phytol kinase
LVSSQLTNHQTNQRLDSYGEREKTMLLNMNPLGPERAFIWDVIALVLTFGVIQTLVLANGFLQKREILPRYITRKVIHIFAAPLYVMCWLLFSGEAASRYLALVVPLAFIGQFAAIGLGLRKDEAFVNSMSRSGNPRELLGGTMHYAIVMLVCTVLFFETAVPNTMPNPAALLILGALAGGDGLADIIGRRYGKGRTFGLGGSQKSVPGSIAMFVGALGMSLILVAIFSINTDLSVGLVLLPAVLLSLLATIVEALSPKGLDNYTIAVAVLVGIVILSLVGLWPFSPLFTL